MSVDITPTTTSRFSRWRLTIARVITEALAALPVTGSTTVIVAFDQAGRLLGWDPKKLPRGIGRGA